MKAVFVGEGAYVYKGVEYLHGVPATVPEKDEGFLRGIGVFQFFPEGFDVSTNSNIIPLYTSAKTELDSDFVGRRILVKRLGGIGDIIGALSTCALLKHKGPTCHVALALPKWLIPFAELFNDCVDELVPYENSQKRDCYSNFDYIIDLIYTVEQNEQRRTTDYYDLYKARLGWFFEKFGVVLPKINLKHTDKINEWLDGRSISRDQFIILHPGGSSELRRWGLDRWKALAYELSNNTNYYIIITGGDEDQGVEDSKTRIYSAKGIPIEQIPDLVQASKLVVTTDTGVLHIAGLLEKQSVSLWGNTAPSSVISYYRNTKTISGTCPISPCFALKKSGCPHLKIIPECMSRIHIPDVLNLISESGIMFKPKFSPLDAILKKQQMLPMMYSKVWGNKPIDYSTINTQGTMTSILYITQSEPKVYSGGRYYGWLNAKMMAMANYDVWVLTNTLPPFYKDFELYDYKGNFHVIVDPALDGTKFPCKFDYVVGEPYYTGKNAMDVAKLKGSKLVTYVYETPNYIKDYRDGDDTNEVFWATHKEAMLASDLIIPLSELGVQKVLEWDDKFKGKNIQHLYPTTNEVSIKSVQRGEYKGYNSFLVYDFCFISLNRNYKGLKSFVYACIQAAEIKGKQLKVLLIGYGVSKAVTKSKMGKVEFVCLDTCPDDVKFTALQKSRVLVMPSKFEGFGIPIIEALATSRRVITTDMPITREIFKDGQHIPYYFKPDDENDLIKQLLAAMDPATFLRKKGRAGFSASSYYRSKFSQKKSKKRIRQLFPKAPTGHTSAGKVQTYANLFFGMVSPYNEMCGIAENTKYYLEHCKFSSYSIYPPIGGRITVADEDYNGNPTYRVALQKQKLTRCWDRGFLDYKPLYDHIVSSKRNVIHIQHEFSFFRGEQGHKNLCEFIKALSKKGIRTAITFHTYKPDDPKIEELSSLVNVVTICNHTAFKEVKLKYPNRRIVHIGLPIIISPWVNPKIARLNYPGLNFKEDDFVIGAQGFWQPHKCFDLLVRVMPYAIRMNPNAKLFLVGAYDKKSEYAHYVRKLISHLELDDHVTILNSYLTIGNVMNVLKVCNVLVYDYNIKSHYSSSAAVRTGLGSQVPVIASDSTMFSDVRDYVTTCKMNDVPSLFEAVKYSHVTVETAKGRVKLVENFLRRWRYSRVAKIYNHLYTDLHCGRYDSSPVDYRSNIDQERERELAL